MLRRDTSPRGSAGGGAASMASRARSRSADAKSAMGSRVSRTTAIPIATLPNDVRCMTSRYDMVMSNDCRRGLAVYAGGKHGIVSVRSALSGAANSIGQLGKDATFGVAGASSSSGGSKGGLSSKTSRMLSDAVTASDYVHRRHGVTVECMALVAAETATLLWCGMSDGTVQVFRTAAAPGDAETAFANPPSPRGPQPGAGRVTTKSQHATPKSLVYTAKHHSGPVTCIAAGEGAVFTGGSDWKINRWLADEPFGMLGSVGTHSLAVRSLLVLPRSLVSGSDDGSVRVWPFTTIDKAGTLEGHTEAVLTLAFHRGLLWTGSEDATIRLWSIEGNRQCIKTITTHRLPVVSFQPLDNLMISFDKGGSAMVWDLRNAPTEIEALHCYQSIGGVVPATTSTTAPGAAASSRTPSEASGAFVPSVAGGSSSRRSVSVASSVAPSAVSSNTGGTTSRQPSLATLKAPQAVHNVKIVANVNGFIAWVFTASEGAKLSFLPFRSIEEELEVKYGELGEDEAMSGSTFQPGKMSTEEMRQRIEDLEQREERREELMHELQEEFAEFSDILGEDLHEVLEESMDLFIAAQQRATNLYCASVTLVHKNQLRAASSLNKRTQELEASMEDLNAKLAEKARQVAQANAKSAQQLTVKTDEVTKLQIDVQRANNEKKQLQFELAAAKEAATHMEQVAKKHEAKLGKSARGEVELSQMRAELKVTRDALERMQAEAGRQSEENARDRARVMGDDAERAQVLEDMERQYAAVREREITSQHELRAATTKVGALEGRCEEQEREIAALRRRLEGRSAGAALSQEQAVLEGHIVQLEEQLDALKEENEVLRSGGTGATAAGGGGPDASSMVSSEALSQAQDVIAELTSDLNALSSADERGEQYGTVLRTKTEELVSARAELRNRERTIEQLQKRQKEAAANTAALQGAIDEMRGQLNKSSSGARKATSRKTSRKAVAPDRGSSTVSGTTTTTATAAAKPPGDAVGSGSECDTDAETSATVTTATLTDVASSVPSRSVSPPVGAAAAPGGSSSQQQRGPDVKDAPSHVDGTPEHSADRPKRGCHGPADRTADVARREDIHAQLQQPRGGTTRHTHESRTNDEAPRLATTASAEEKAAGGGPGHPRTGVKSTVGGAAAADSAPLSALEKMSYDLDAPSGATAAPRVSPAETSPPRAPVRYTQRPIGSRSGLVALREAERILGDHAIGLSDTAHDVLGDQQGGGPSQEDFTMRSRDASRAPQPPLRRGSNSRRQSPEQRPVSPGADRSHAAVVHLRADDEEVIVLDEDGDTRPQSPFAVPPVPAALPVAAVAKRGGAKTEAETELDRLVDHIHSSRRRLERLEVEVARSPSPEHRERRVKQIAAVHRELTAASGAVHVLAAGRGEGRSILERAQERLHMAERILEIQEISLTPGQPSSASTARRRSPSGSAKQRRWL